MKLTAYLAVSFIMTPFLVKTLGTTLYGIWAMVLSVVGYMNLIDMGMQSAVMKYVAEYTGKEDKQGLAQIIANALLFYLIIACVGGLILAFLVWAGLPLLGIHPDQLKMVQTILWIMGIDMLLTLPGTVFLGVLQGAQLFYVANTVSIILTLIRAGIVYWALFMGYKLIALAVISLLGNLLEYGIFFSIVQWYYRFFSIKKNHFTLSMLRKMVSFGSQSFLVIMGGRIYLGTDSLLVGYFMSAASVPFYNIPANLINYSRSLLWSLTQSFLPMFSYLEAKKDFQALRSVFLNFTRYTCLCIFPVIALLIACGEPFLRIWIGPEFAEKGGDIISLLSLALLMTAIQPLSSRLLTGLSKQGSLIWTGFASAGIFIGLGIWLIKSYGLVGLAVAFLAGSVIPSFFVLQQSLTLLNLPLRKYLEEALAPSLIPGFLTLIFLWTLKKWSYPTGYGNLSLHCFLGVIFFLILGFFITLTNEERKVIEVKIRSYFNKKDQPS